MISVRRRCVREQQKKPLFAHVSGWPRNLRRIAPVLNPFIPGADRVAAGELTATLVVTDSDAHNIQRILVTLISG